MKFDRSTFFEEYRKSFGGLSSYQVQGLNRLLRLYEQYFGWWDNLSQIANSLSQIKHETNRTFNPVVEAYYLGDVNAPNPQDFYQGKNDRVRRVQKSFRYYPYFGMGDIQLTWLDNFEKHDKLLHTYFPEIVKEFETRSSEKLDLVKYPRQVLDGEISFAVMTIGMHRGTFRGGRKLDDYKTAKGFDHFNARGIVNGDKFYDVEGSPLNVGQYIEKDALAFEKILKKSLVVNAENVSEVIDKLQESDHVSAVSNNPQVNPSGGNLVNQSADDQPAVPPKQDQEFTEGEKPKADIFGSLEKYGSKFDQVDAIASKVSNSSWVVTILTKITGLALLVWSLVIDNPIESVIAVALIIAAVWYLSQSKNRGVERAKLKS